ncbi:MAG: hypothetical protein HC921_16555 [Synechococcaceae cyanobacterium SM2_3_1]|nr:hypothetical protein [Synechococcaceae cyanobacterium SM2_3_1]
MLHNRRKILGAILWLLVLQDPVLGLPPAEDTPEEILRAQPNLRLQSPLDNQPLTPQDYAQLQEELKEQRQREPEIDPELQQLIFLLRLRKAFRSLLGF